MKVKKIIKIAVISVGMTSLLANTLVFLHIFLTAYTHYTRQTIVDINLIGEANLELSLIIIGLITGFYTLYWFMDSFKTEVEAV